MRLYGQRLVKELLVVVLLGGVAKYDAFARVIPVRTTCASHHLQNISDGIVSISLLLSLIILCAHDYHQIAGDGAWQSPALVSSDYKHLKSELDGWVQRRERTKEGGRGEVITCMAPVVNNVSTTLFSDPVSPSW